MRHPWLSPAQKRRQKSVARQLADLERLHGRALESIQRTTRALVAYHEVARECDRLGQLDMRTVLRKMPKVRGHLEDAWEVFDALPLPDTRPSDA